VHAPADGYALLLAHTAKAIKATLKRNGRWLVAHLVRDGGGRRFKSCHSDQLSRRSDCLRDQLCGTAVRQFGHDGQRAWRCSALRPCFRALIAIARRSGKIAPVAFTLARQARAQGDGRSPRRSRSSRALDRAVVAAFDDSVVDRGRRCAGREVPAHRHSRWDLRRPFVVAGSEWSQARTHGRPER
jgi:hypothetical protein